MAKAQETRIFILSKAFELVYRNGFQATSIDDIIATTGLTKGAFYYHFKTKEDMGLAMIKEVMAPGMRRSLIDSLEDASDPVEAIYIMMKNILHDQEHFDIRYGCPAINLVEEMAPLNKRFKNTLTEFAKQWQEAIQECIRHGKAKGIVRQDVDGRQVAVFIISGYGGVRNMGKVFGMQCYTSYLKELRNYLQTLK